ncbi:ComZ family protein [Alkalicoccobacillus murimartini]|uniref:Competence protein ComZ n=1 Tax=Alkalicoccobacillus murimartini TaxID=171685 RepID=A0ABT9YJR8_9BACI|nr:ComZ family protein [Alkalicoccobacillus murimartini]MDQ0207924.1 competence protein ComZ [Alkalicoccobacillus murimartini]
MTNPELNMKLMQLAMKHLPEGQEFFKEKGIELGFEDMQPVLELFLKVMTEAYELGKSDAETQQ